MPEQAVLFDFDGTLADTAPDLGAAVNWLRTQRNLEALPIDEVRPYASMGARGLLRIGFGMTPEHPEYLGMREAFLTRYEQKLFEETTLFPGIAELLGKLRQRGIAWGIVTNKAMRFASRIVEALALEPDCLVCGDSTPYLKPNPASLLLAAQKLKLEPSNCCYLGDDLRDMQAASAAGMRPIAVEWGYHHPEQGGPGTWNADAVIARPTQLVALL
jgi:phosphoglycolate phosphatase